VFVRKASCGSTYVNSRFEDKIWLVSGMILFIIV